MTLCNHKRAAVLKPRAAEDAAVRWFPKVVLLGTAGRLLVEQVPGFKIPVMVIPEEPPEEQHEEPQRNNQPPLATRPSS